MIYDLSIIISTMRPTNLAQVLNHIENQSHAGIAIETIIVQESNTGFDNFYNIKIQPHTTVLRQALHNDYGAAAKDAGINTASGEYLAFWDDDNIYYGHALASLYSTAYGHDVGIVRTRFRGYVIPPTDDILPGQIDTMCLCVAKRCAVGVNWGGSGRYSDYRWINKLPKASINYSKIIIGEHL